jgi:cytochrome c-type biogenesis protein CcmH
VKFLSTILLTAALAAAAPVTDVAYRRVADRLICQCGCSQTVGGCNHLGCSVAANLRKEVREAIANTPTEERALELVVQKYGVQLLAEPPKSGFNYTAWIMPFAVLLGGMLLVTLILRSWRRQTTTAASSAAPLDPALLARFEKRIDDEIDKN